MLDKDASMVTLAVCGKVLICLCFLYFNSRFADFSTQENKLEVGNGYVETVLINFIAGASAAITIFVARPIINILGKAEEISIYDPLTLLGCFMAGMVSVSASCQNITIEDSILIGSFGTILFMLSKKILIKLEVDDA